MTETSTASASSFAQRMIRAARLEVALYEEVEADKEATGQAAAVVVLSSVAAGIGSVHAGGAFALLIGALGALLGWAIWAVLIFLIGTKAMPEPQTDADVGELLRTLGFASSPGLLRVLGVFSPLAGIVALVVAAWTLAAMVVAVRQALDYESTGRAVGVCLIAFIVQLIVLVPLLGPMLAR